MRLKEFIQLIHFKEFVEECEDVNYNFLSKYINYIELIITQNNDNKLNIADIKFKSKEIENKFISDYKNIIVEFINNEEDMKELFSGENVFFFRKTINIRFIIG